MPGWGEEHFYLGVNKHHTSQRNPFIVKSVNFMQTIMLKMNAQLELEKLRLIEWLIGLQDVRVLEALNKMRQANEVATYEASLKPMTVEELVARAEESDRDIEAGRVYDIDEVIKEDLGE